MTRLLRFLHRLPVLPVRLLGLGFLGIAFALGAWGLAELADRDPAFAGDRARRLAELASFRLPLHLAEVLPWHFPAARWALAGGATLLLVASGARWWRPHLARALALRQADHVVICGDTVAADHLALELADRKRIVVVVRRTASRAGPLSPRVLEIDGDASEESALVRAGVREAAALVVASESDGWNLAVAAAARTLGKASRAPGRENLRCIVQIRDGTLRTTAGDPARIATQEACSVSVFSPERTAARRLLREWPPHRHADLHGGRPLAAVIIGWTPFSEQILYSLLHSGCSDETGPRIAVFDPAAAELERVFRGRFADLMTACPISFHALDPDTLERSLAPAWNGAREAPLAAAYLSLADPLLAYRAALAFAEGLQAERAHIPPLFYEVDAHRQWLPPLLDDAGSIPLAIPVDVEDLALSAAFELGDPMDELARAVHEVYLRQVGGPSDDAASAPSQRSWARLPETFRDASRHQADHIDVKLRLLGLVRRPASGVDALQEPGALERQESFERAARLEHTRWMFERWLDGWRYGPVRDDSLRRHPQLVPFDQLSEGQREKDREAIRKLPFLVSLAGQEVVREHVVGMVAGAAESHAPRDAGGFERALREEQLAHPDRHLVLAVSFEDTAAALLAERVRQQYGVAVRVILEQPVYPRRSGLGDADRASLLRLLAHADEIPPVPQSGEPPIERAAALLAERSHRLWLIGEPAGEDRADRVRRAWIEQGRGEPRILSGA